MSASAVASTSESETFRKEFIKYNTTHTELKDGPLPRFVKSYTDLGQKINTTFNLPTPKLDDAVAKLKAVEQLVDKLPGLTTEYNQIRDGITLNNADLEALKLRIEAAITAKNLATAAAKAAQDASNAAQARALADAKKALQTQIVELKKLKDERNDAFEQELTLKNQRVLHNVQIVINKVDGIKNLLLQGEHISQATRDMVEGIDKDVTTFISGVDFESIATQFKARHETEIAGIQAQIDALTDAMNGGDINGMRQALASNPLGISATLGDFISVANTFIGTLDAKLTELDGAEAGVTDAIVVDKDIAVKRDIEVLLEDAKKVDDSVKLFVDKLDEAEKIVVRSPSFNVLLGALLGKAITTLEPFGRQVTEFNHRFQQINQKTNASYKSSDNYLALKKTIDGLNELYKAQQSKYDALNAKYTNYKAAVATPPSTLRPSSAAPRNLTAAAAAAAAGRASPQEGWNKEQPLKPIPIDNEQPDAADADIASEPVTPPPPIIGARRNFLYVSHNTEPKTAYLIVVKKPRVGESNVGGGGNKNYHVQKGGAPPPVKLPEGSEIFPIDVDNKGFGDVMAGLLPPSVLLTINPDGTGENPIITNIRGGRRLKGDRIALLYDKIKSELITDENQNPLTIGLRAVYYQNIIKLIRLLDFNLGHGGMSYEEMFEKLRKFMDFTDGTFGVLEALFDATFKRNPTSPRPNTPQEPPPKIDAVFKRKSQIKTIVGWKSNSENTHFDMLFDKLSIICPNGKKNTFLTDDDPATQKNLGSKKTGYNQFRLNWIILLAFHTLYIGKSRPPDVGELIKALYDAFLGWMAMTTHKDTFERMFRNTLVSQTPAQAYSEQVVKRINEINGSDPTLQPLVKAIQTKLCELENVPKPAIDVPHNDEYDDEMNDPDYVPPQEGDDSDDDSVRSSELAEAAAELRPLSPPEKGLGRTRSQRPFRPAFRRDPMTPDELLSAPSDERDPDLDFMNDSDLSDVEEPAERPKVPPLTYPIGQSLGGPQSERTGYPYDRSLGTLTQLKDMGVSGLGRLPPARPSSSPSSSQSGSIFDRPRQTLRPGAVSPFHTVANKKAAKTGMLLPQTTEEELRYQQQRSQPNVLTMPRKPLSVGLSYRPLQAAPASTPAAPASTPAASASTPAPPPEQPREGTIVRRQQQSFKRRELKPFKQGGNNKKRTRKHKKHTSISASRRPTRRRRIPPTEGHKYTRKRPRT